MLLKSAMLLATALLVGAGVGRYWLLARSQGAVATNVMALIGMAALVAFSLLDLRTALLNVIPSADAALLWRYSLTSGHGTAVQPRLALAFSLAALVCLPSSRGAGAGVAFAVGAVGLLGSFSVISHGAGMGGWRPLATDLVHFTAAGTWAGAVFALAFAVRWREELRPVLVDALRRLSRLGLIAVSVLALTGVLSALVHAGDPARFLGSRYFVALAVKVGLVVVVVGLAAANRFRLLPRLLAGRSLMPLRGALRVEAMLLLGVLIATGWLSTTAVPHGSDASVEALENARRMIDHLSR